jgi:hypothetical protein
VGEWARDTPWRQGHILHSDAAEAFALIGEDCPSDTVVVVVSHDCDLAQLPGAEPEIEVIVGRRITKTIDGNFTHAKNARRLHLTFSAGSATLSADLVATQKRKIPKDKLADHKPVKEFRLTSAEGTILQRWLAARYRRSAFPDEFDKRLETTGLQKRISGVLKTSGAWISAILIDVDNGQDVTRSGPDDPYVLAIYLLYSTDTDSEKAEQVARNAAVAIEAAFRDKCLSQKSGTWQTFELIECSPVSDEAMTVHQAEHLKKWRADHLSLRMDPPQSMLKDE